jgi:hypothetical protein
MNHPVPVTGLAMKAEQAGLSIHEASSVATQHGISLGRLLDMISLDVADRYEAGSLPFAEVDRTMNVIWGLIFSQPASEVEIPEVTEDIFNAFDQGEYCHSEDSPDIDPKAKYTKPMLKAALAKHRHVA